MRNQDSEAVPMAACHRREIALVQGIVRTGRRGISAQKPRYRATGAHARVMAGATGWHTERGRFYPPWRPRFRVGALSVQQLFHASRPGRRLSRLAFASRLILSSALLMLFSYGSSSPLPVGIDLLSARLLVIAGLAGTGGFRGVRLRADGCQLLVMAVCGRCALRPGWLFLRIVALPARPGIPFDMLLRHG